VGQLTEVPEVDSARTFEKNQELWLSSTRKTSRRSFSFWGVPFLQQFSCLILRSSLYLTRNSLYFAKIALRARRLWQSTARRGLTVSASLSTDRERPALPGALARGAPSPSTPGAAGYCDRPSHRAVREQGQSVDHLLDRRLRYCGSTSETARWPGTPHRMSHKGPDCVETPVDGILIA